MLKNQMEINVQVNGRPVKEYVHNGITYIEGKKESKYSIKLKNNTGYRVMAVVSVDGLDVIKGKSASESDSGYIIDSYSTIEIKGYRLDNDNVAEFIFDGCDKSYATEKSGGDKTNNGVIGVRFFSEKSKYFINIPDMFTYESGISGPVGPQWTTGSNPWVYNPIVTYTNSNERGFSTSTSTTTNSGNVSINTQYNYSAPNNLSPLTGTSLNFCQISFCDDESSILRSAPSIPTNDLGTSWGKKVDDKVGFVNFEKGKLESQMEIYYSSRKSLQEIGIDFSEKKQIYRPQAFGTGSFCEPPKKWNEKLLEDLGKGDFKFVMIPVFGDYVHESGIRRSLFSYELNDPLIRIFPSPHKSFNIDIEIKTSGGLNIKESIITKPEISTYKLNFFESFNSKEISSILVSHYALPVSNIFAPYNKEK